MRSTPTALLAGVTAVQSAALEGSATRAAAQLETTAATILRRIEGAETALGVPLFERLPTGLVPTPALELVLPWIEQVIAAAAGMQREVAGLESTPSGLVRLAAPPTLANQFLVPALPDLRDTFPGLQLELASASAVVDLVQREADLALRVVQPESGDLVLRKLIDYRLAIVCAPSLLERHPEATLTELPWVTWESRLAHILEARWLRDVIGPVSISLRASDLNTLLSAAQAGLGALVVPEPTAAMAGGLVQLPTNGLELPTSSIWLVAHRALRAVPRVDAVWQWVERRFEELEEQGLHRLLNVTS